MHQGFYTINFNTIFIDSESTLIFFHYKGNS